MPSNPSEDTLAIRKRGMNYLRRPGVGFKTRTAPVSVILLARESSSEGGRVFGGRF